MSIYDEFQSELIDFLNDFQSRYNCEIESISLSEHEDCILIESEINQNEKITYS